MANERFSHFRKKELIKMWRTLKAESGYRTTLGAGYNCTLRELMNQHEERATTVREHRMRKRLKRWNLKREDTP